MSEQNRPAAETSDPVQAEPLRLGWGFLAVSVPGLAAAGALSYRAGALMPLSDFTLAPAATVLFGLLAGGVQALALRRQAAAARWWLLASALAGFLAACAGLMPTALAATPEAWLAGWAYGWTVYGAVLGVMLQRIYPDRRLMPASTAGWATAGIVSGVVGWALDVLQATATDPALSPLPAIARTWSMGGLAAIGAVCGAVGAAITPAVMILLSRGPAVPSVDEETQAKDRRRANVAGVVGGLIGAAFCTYAAPLVVTQLTQGSLESVDLTIFFLSVIVGTPVCISAIGVVSIPLGIGCAHAGLMLARDRGGRGSRLWVWVGAAIGGVVGALLGSLAVYAVAALVG